MGKPRLILIIRHAQSEGNRDKTIHQTTPDHRVGLTDEGHRQALEAGEKLRALLRTDDTLHFFISPYRRTRETTEGILKGLCSNDPVPSPFQRPHIKVYEEPRLREQDFGNFQPGTEETERLWRERAEYGHFFYRIPNGESGADVYDRVSSFNGSLWRRFSEDTMASVAILVTHGLCSRVFLMAWYHYSVEFFEDLRNINHCEFLVMRHAPNGRYVLQNQLRRWSDLRRERAARKESVSHSSAIESPPVRRWAQTTKSDSPSSTGIPRPARKNTADMFNDEAETLASSLEERQRPPKWTPSERRSSREPEKRSSRDPERGGSRGPANSKAENGTRVRSSSNLQHSFSNLTLDTEQKNSNLSAPKFYLGRDGGGTKSGRGSPYGSDDEEAYSESPRGGSSANLIVSESPDKLKKPFPSALAMALRGELDDPNRRMADALGDQSDAEVDEADLELGTKDRISGEMEQILEEEIRERSHRGSVY
jgi:broad specificity phosphatase PhoE